jgi:hypothetical protein
LALALRQFLQSQGQEETIGGGYDRGAFSAIDLADAAAI